MSEFWCVRRKILRHQRLCLVAGKYLEKAPQLPAPCTFPSAVSGSSWVLSAAFLRGCGPQAGFFCCLSYGHVKALRKNKVLKQWPTSPLCHLLVFVLFSCTFLFDYVVSFRSQPLVCTAPRFYFIFLYFPTQLCSEL